MTIIKSSENNKKAIRLIEYLLHVASLRMKLIRDVTEYERVFWISDLPRERGCFTLAWGRDEEHEVDEWLEIQSRREPDLPAVPEQCKAWVNQSSLRNTKDLPELFSTITIQTNNPDWHEGSEEPEYISHTENLKEHPEIQRQWNRYVEDKWFPWTEEHNVWEKIHKAYSALFAIHQEQLRLGEEYELVLGLGLLTWQTPSGQRVRRHLVVADTILEFEARLGKFIVRPHTEGAKLRPELNMLDVEEQPARSEEIAKSSLLKAEDDPWEKECVEGVLQALIHSINSQGIYEDSLKAVKHNHISTKPVVEYAPALILRKRSAKGLTEMLKGIKERIENGDDIPDGLSDLAEIQHEIDDDTNGDPKEANDNFDGEVFFPKPSNDEQRRIVEKIGKASGVLVQGPPGTGKSHTIANLICHLLATGQRTLITAKTPRALQVLEGLVPEELRPLCINLLGSGLEERRSLESSVGGILRKNDDWNEERAKNDCRALEERIRRLREEKAKVDRRLRDIRESEIHDQSIAEGTYRGTAARIAEAVNRDRSTYKWFTDVAPLEKTCPVSEHILQDYLSALRYFTPDKRKELSLGWPEVLPGSGQFATCVENEKRAIEEHDRFTSRADEQLADLVSGSDIIGIKKIRDVLSEFNDIQKRLKTSPYSWMSDAFRNVVSGNSSLWKELYRVTNDATASIETTVSLADDVVVDFPETINLKTLYEDACILKIHMENGGKLGWGPFRHKKIKERLYVIKKVCVDGRPCSTVEHFSILSDVLRVRMEIEKAWGYWIGHAEKPQGPYSLQLHTLKALCKSLMDVLSLEALVGKYRGMKRESSVLCEPDWFDESNIQMLIATCRLAMAKNHKHAAEESVRNIAAPIESFAANRDIHPVTTELLHAIRCRNVELLSISVDENFFKRRSP